MLLEIFHTTTVNTKQIKDTQGLRLVSDRRDNPTRSDAAMLVWTISFRSFMCGGMLLEIFHTTTVNTKQIQHTHGMRLDGDRRDNPTRSDASVLVLRISFRSFISVACS